MKNGPAIVLFLALVSIAPALAGRHPATANWQPYADQKGDTGQALDKERVTFRNDNVEIRIELLDDEKRKIFLQSAGIETADPFSTRNIGWRTFTFLIRITNLGDQEVQFRPQSFFFITKGPLSNSTPCDFTCLIAAGERAKLTGDEGRRLLRAVMDTGETVTGGGKISKLLVFTRMPDAFKKFVLDLDGFSVEGEVFRVAIPYAVPKPEKNAKKDRP
ncbi:MAG: hypothetical protein E2P00_00540 [Acidobacteria bacterium]|nr:MAG: hypothetical protein E2P03_02025 [Acidobacteriota bacterium]TDI47832.1 MAG: hypothetical protein E2P00_00540 [Acidobacteriota bacterium]